MENPQGGLQSWLMLGRVGFESLLVCVVLALDTLDLLVLSGEKGHIIRI